MTERITFAVPITGVGRKDYSQDIQASVEPLVRSHQMRDIWSYRYYLPTYAYGVNFWAGQIYFLTEDRSEVLPYCPAKPIYTLYDFQTVAGLNALTECGLFKLTYPEYTFVEKIFHVFGYGKAEAKISRGYVCEPGFTYAMLVTVYSDEPAFFVTANMAGMDDRLVEG